MLHCAPSHRLYVRVLTVSCVPLSCVDSTCVSLCCAADTPIEEFTPTPAFPALQYLESVDEGGVAWQAGLRTGDFLIEVRAAAPLFFEFGN